MKLKNPWWKSVCDEHTNSPVLNEFIEKESIKGFCDYCEKDSKVVDLESLSSFMEETVLPDLYEDPANFMSYNGREGGYLGETFDTNELLQDHLYLETEPFKLMEDLIYSIGDKTWGALATYHHDPLSFEHGWYYFNNVVTYKTRYLFYETDYVDMDGWEGKYIQGVLKEIGKYVNHYGFVQSLKVDRTLYRGRQHNIETTISKPNQIVSPPKENAIFPNRFSPSGIPMLYAAFDKETAFLETVDSSNKTNNHISFAKFKLKRKIKVVDFSKTPKVSNALGILDEITLITDLVQDLTKGIKKDGKEHIEYVPTQVVTEYLRYIFSKNRKTKIEGIIYPSSKNEFRKSIVIFWENKECLENLDLIDIDKRKIIFGESKKPLLEAPTKPLK